MADRRTMHESPGTILRQIAKTAVLVAVLGALLYGAVTLVAQQRHGAQIMGVILGAPMAALLGFVVVDALRSGVFPEKFRAVHRADQPVAFWCSIGWTAGCGLMMAALTIWCAAELIAPAP